MNPTTDEVLNQPLSEVKAELFKALGHPGRVRVLEVLRDGDRVVSDLVPLVGLEASNLSQQLGILRRAGVVTATRSGSSVVYSIADPAIPELLDAARTFLINSIHTSQELLADLHGDRG
jgi:ArsR family transcriptional regulator